MLDSVAGVARDARARVAEIDDELATLRAQREKIEYAMPHIDDLVAWVGRNIDRHRDHYVKRAMGYLHPALAQSRGWSAFDDPEMWRNGFAAFRLDTTIAVVHGYASPTDRDQSLSAPIDAAALVALLAEPLKAGARDFLLRLLPETERGVRRAERDAELARLDEQLAALARERQDILEELQKAVSLP
ncbi:MAG: hypothetical protein ACOZDY_08885 [Pseudomonadota bacterium]